jgi:hypothetical protein
MAWALASDSSCEFTDTQTSEITYLIEPFFCGLVHDTTKQFNPELPNRYRYSPSKDCDHELHT